MQEENKTENMSEEMLGEVQDGVTFQNVSVEVADILPSTEVIDILPSTEVEM